MFPISNGMDSIIIFSAKYLIYFLPLLLGIYFLTSKSERKIKMTVFFAFFLPLAYLLGLLAAGVYENPRPFVVGGFEPLIPHEANNGFPSNHALLGASLAVGAYFFSKRLSLALWLMAGIVAGARVYAGVHHLLDVVASAIIAILAGMMAYFLLKRYEDAIMRRITKLLTNSYDRQ